MGWIVERHAVLYQASHGWDDTFEAMVARICADFLDGYDPTGERSWIAEVDGQRAGAIVLVRHSQTIAQLRLLFVEPWARGLGIGGHLVSECVSQARDFGYRGMMLFTVRGLDAARYLYENEGFILAEEKRSELWGKHEWEQKWEVVL
jgi:GNAT superfamily N-acetyltransferase